MDPKNSKICLSLSGISLSYAVDLADMFKDWVYAVKAHDLIDADGRTAARLLYDAGAENVWFDLKLHDGKDTVKKRVKAHVKNGARIISVHASGGIPMMRAAVEAAYYPWGKEGVLRTEIWAVTVLSTLDEAEVIDIYNRTPTQQALVLALMAKQAGVHGVICSPQEVGVLSHHPDLAGMKFVVVGTRPEGVALGQQKRSGTPRQAITDGATHLVLESVVLKAKDPRAAFVSFAQEAGMDI